MAVKPTLRAVADPAITTGSASIRLYGQQGQGNVRTDLFSDWLNLTPVQTCARLWRKEVTNQDIMVMSIGDVVGLYYSLLNWNMPKGRNCPIITPHPVISRGLSDAEARLVEEDLRERIYAYRPELRQMQEVGTGKLIDIIVRPQDIMPGCLPSFSDQVAGYAWMAVLAVAGLASGGAAIATAVMSAAAAQSATNQAAKMVENFSKVRSALRHNIQRAIRGELVPYDKLQIKASSNSKIKRYSLAKAQMVSTSDRGWSLARQLGLEHPAMACISHLPKGTKVEGGEGGCSPSMQEKYLEQMILDQQTKIGLQKALDKERSEWQNRVKMNNCNNAVNFDADLLLPSVRELINGGIMSPFPAGASSSTGGIGGVLALAGLGLFVMNS